MCKGIKLVVRIATTFVFLSAIGNPAYSRFESGVDAFNRGDFKTAYQEWLQPAINGDVDAARNLARLYHDGKGVGVDYAQARKWYKFAADKCNATAQNNLGLMYLNGQGGPKDDVIAFRLFQVAANQALHADAEAMGNLAGMYLNGAGTQPNIIEAYKWYYLYSQYTIDPVNSNKLKSYLPQVQAHLTETQLQESKRRIAAFQKTRCIPAR